MTPKPEQPEIDWDKLQCRFASPTHNAPVIGIYHVPKGCICWPDPIQALCMQHFVTAESAGPIVCIVVRPEED